MTVAELLAETLRGVPIAWIVDERGKTWPPSVPHRDHVYDGGCAVCRLADRSEALDAVVAALADVLVARGVVARNVDIDAPRGITADVLGVEHVDTYALPVVWRGREDPVQVRIVRGPCGVGWSLFAHLGGAHWLSCDHRWWPRATPVGAGFVFDTAEEALQAALDTVEVLEVAAGGPVQAEEL